MTGMKNDRKPAGLILLALWLGSFMLAEIGWGKDASEVTGPATSQLVIPSSCELAGKVLKPDGKSPMPDVSIEIWNTDESKTVCKTKADKNGDFKLPKLSPGSYEALFGDRVCVNLRVVKGAVVEMDLLNVTIPREKEAEPPQIPMPVGNSQK